ncbi:MAG: hypothetical protein AVDCRST_MAG42-1615 [uncultured Chthoniobacterales bacterium]|uniref:ASCH domain-containing protein n=1 Tax=uncultured Chthoniobacterales bacterium TaxID=1836801 RepID=A0A6J4I218_9BACT|nr:MAG: hypothetical protein AVDCRST_MAG42-1615 [uncultured Chthoniobacterales bacterium]
MHASVEAMWRSFLHSRGETPETSQLRLSSFHFCDKEHDADLCARLVVAGVKRATSPSLWFFESRAERLPAVGDLHVITNWAGEAQCVVRTTQVEVVPFDQVTEEHAAAEGEGDGTLAWWRRVHWEYYARELSGTQFERRADMPIVCERFERIW